MAFTPVSNTFVVVATMASKPLVPTISPTPSAADILNFGVLNYSIVVNGTVPVWVQFAAAGAAAPTAVIPADGASGNGILIPPNVSYTLALPYGTQFAVIASGVGSSVYACIGGGVLN